MHRASQALLESVWRARPQLGPHAQPQHIFHEARRASWGCGDAPVLTAPGHRCLATCHSKPRPDEPTLSRPESPCPASGAAGSSEPHRSCAGAVPTFQKLRVLQSSSVPSASYAEYPCILPSCLLTHRSPSALPLPLPLHPAHALPGLLTASHISCSTDRHGEHATSLAPWPGQPLGHVWAPARPHPHLQLCYPLLRNSA